MERFYKGLTAGALAGIPMNAWSLTSFALGLTGRRYLDWMGVMLYGRPPESALEQAYALLVHFGWLAFLGPCLLISGLGCLRNWISLKECSTHW